MQISFNEAKRRLDRIKERQLTWRYGYERDFTDRDYPGRGLEFEFLDIPN